MFETERTLYAFLLDYTHRLVADVDESELARSPIRGMNHPVWILGHLAVCTDYALHQLGERKLTSKRWHFLFGPGSELRPQTSIYPTKNELLAALDAGHEDVSAASERADPAAMERPHDIPIAFLEGKITTAREFVAHLMTTHPAVHIGQLSAWRRACGKPGVLAL
jgi:hypothetical protein